MTDKDETIKRQWNITLVIHKYEFQQKNGKNNTKQQLWCIFIYERQEYKKFDITQHSIVLI